MSLLLAFLAGVAIGVYQTVRLGHSDARQNAIFAYRTVGLAIEISLAGIMRLVTLGDYNETMQDNLFYYVETPYELCALGGAYIATVGLAVVGDIAAIVSSRA